jgi:hypothetical protein
MAKCPSCEFTLFPARKGGIVGDDQMHVARTRAVPSAVERKCGTRNLYQSEEIAVERLRPGKVGHWNGYVMDRFDVRALHLPLKRGYFVWRQRKCARTKDAVDLIGTAVLQQ